MDSTEHVSIAGYVRVSGLQQVKFGISLPEQRKAIETYAKAYGCTLYQIYADEGFSGMVSDRPALTRMREDAQKGLFQKVVFTYIDRFGRSAGDTPSDYTYFEELGISLYSIREGLDTSTALGRFFRTILAGAAEMERERN
jgi:site-specific DNA recombinase